MTERENLHRAALRLTVALFGLAAAACGGTKTAACPAVGCPPTVVASGQMGLGTIALDATHLYWSTYSGGIGAVTRHFFSVDDALDAGDAGPAPTTIVSGPFTVTDFAIHAPDIYWGESVSNGNGTANGTVMKAPLDGGRPVTVAQYTPTQIAVDVTAVYWAGDISIYSAAHAGGAPVTLVSGLFNVSDLALDSTLVYFSLLAPQDGATVKSVPLGGGDPTPFSSAGKATAIALDDANVYWTNADPGAGAVMKAPKAGGDPVTLATADSPVAIAVDAANVYWTQSGAGVGEGSVMKVPLAGGTPTPLAEHQSAPEAIAVNDAGIYWADYQDGTVLRIDKPGCHNDTCK